MQIGNQSLRYVVMGVLCLGLGSLVHPGAFAQFVAQDSAPEEAAEEKPAEKEEPAKDAKKGDDKKASDKDEDEEEKETLEEAVKDLEKIEGLFTFYRDGETGGLLMEISQAQLEAGRAFIYHGINVNGAADVGFNYIVGDYREPKVLRFTKHYERIEVVQENTHFYHDPESPLWRARDANIQPALLAVAEITAKSEDGTRFLIDADALFQGETLSQISPSSYPDHSGVEAFQPGDINSEKTKVVGVKSFDRNSLVLVDFVFDNPRPTVWGEDDTTNARSVTVTFQHSLIAAPEPGFEPRLDDQRVGYFSDRVTDLTDGSATPYRDLINKWRLVKKDPTAEISEPVKPITFWLQNTTPLEFRDAIKKGTLSWNEAFEKAGFKNAVEVKIQPDDAEWDPADVDYNVIRYVSSPQPMYSGIGPSMADPRTGEILATDIVLEHSWAQFMIRGSEIFDEAALVLEDAKSKDASAVAPDKWRCTFAQHMQMNTIYGVASLRAQNASQEDIAGLLQESLVELSAHEVGHVLGLMHNMKGTSTISYEDVHSQAQKEKGYLTGSVMDYTSVNVSNDRSKQGLYFTTRVGPYDLWAIEFGYKPALADASAETARMESLLARSTEKALAFGNDGDDMRSTYGGIDPRTMINDMTDDAIQYGVDRIAFADARLQDLLKVYSVPGATWDEMRGAYFVLTGHKSAQARVISNYIGGVYLERAVVGQEGATAPYTPVDGERQREAMDALAEYIFAPDAWEMPVELIQHLQRSRRGYDQYGVEEPFVHDRILNIQAVPLSVILHPRTMQRMLDSTLYGNDYPPAEVLQDLTDGIFKSDLRGSVNSQRQNLQLRYVSELLSVYSGMNGHALALQSSALYQLKRIEKMERQARSPDVSTSAHREHIRLWIEQAVYGDISR